MEARALLDHQDLMEPREDEGRQAPVVPLVALGQPETLVIPDLLEVLEVLGPRDLQGPPEVKEPSVYQDLEVLPVPLVRMVPQGPQVHQGYLDCQELRET